MKTLKNSSKEDQNSLIPGLYENRIASCSSLFGVMASSKYKKCNLGKHLNNFIGFFFKWSGCQKTCRVHNEEKSKKSLILAINATYTAYYQLDYFSILIPLCLRQQIYRYTYIQKRFIIFAIHIDNLHVCNVIFMRNFSRKTKNFWLWRTEGCVWTHQFLHGPFWTSLIILFLPSKYYTLIFKMGIEI